MRKKKKKNSGKTERPKKKKWNRAHIYFLLLLTAIGFYLRIEPILIDDVIFSYDQGVDISYVRELVVNHKISLISRFTGLEGVFMGPFWTWLLAIPYILSGGNPAANVFMLSLFGIAVIWFTYAIVRYLLNEKIALLTAVYVAVSAPFLAASHVVLTPVLLTILMIFYIWFLWEIIENSDQRYWAPLGFITGLFFQFEIGFAIFLAPATLVVLTAFGKIRKAFSKAGLIAVILFLVPFIPQIAFDFRHDFLISKAVLAFFSGKNTSLGSQQADLFGRFLIRLGSLREDYTLSSAFVDKSLIATLSITIPALLGWWVIFRKENR